MARGDFLSDGGQPNETISPVYLQVKDIALLQIFPLDYNYKNHCALLGSPAETGMMQYDHKVIQPSTVSFTGIVKYSNWNVLKAIRASLRSHTLNNCLCTFYTKSGKAERMMIDTLEEIGNSQRYDGVEVKVMLTEFLEHNTSVSS